MENYRRPVFTGWTRDGGFWHNRAVNNSQPPFQPLPATGQQDCFYRY
jgi:hypothetical protein